MKKDYCDKCGKKWWLEKHHVLPKHSFGEGKTFKLCPNCHTEYHQRTKKILKKKDYKAHYETFYKWLIGISIIVALCLIYF